MLRLFLHIFSLLFVSCATKDLAPIEKQISQKKLQQNLAKELNLDKQTLSSFEVSDAASAPKNEEPVIIVPKRIIKKSAPAPAPIITEIEEYDPKTDPEYPKEFIDYDKKYSSQWRNLKPFYKKGETHRFSINWSVFKAGELKLETLGKIFVGDKSAYGFVADLNSAEYFNKIYRLKDRLESYVSSDTFLPLKYSLIQRESGQNVDDLQLFDQEKLKLYFSLKREKNGKTTNKNQEKFTPKYFLDAFTVLHFIRAIDFKIGDKFSIPVLTRGKLTLLSAYVERIEQVTIMNKPIRAYKIKAETQLPGVLKKSGDIIFWYSADDAKKLLKFEAKIKIGSVNGELIEYVEGSN